MEIITQKEARDQGLVYYYTNKPCKHGHYSLRMVKGGACQTCKNEKATLIRPKNKEYMKSYAKEWHKKTYTKEKRREKYLRNIESGLYSRALRRSKLHNLDFEIDITDIVIPKYCPVLGLEIYQSSDSFPSLDRKDNSKGYIKGNVFVISKRANRLKSDATLHELNKIIQYIKT